MLLVSDIDRLNYTDINGKAGDEYKVVPHGEKPTAADKFTPFLNDYIDVSVNQPPHTKFYVGKAALNGTYLTPETGFDNVIMTQYISEMSADFSGNGVIGYGVII